MPKKFNMAALCAIGLFAAACLVPRLSAADLSVEEATQATVKRIKPYTVWDGPTSGPKLVKDKKIAIINQDGANGGDVLWCQGVADACEAVGWEYIMMDGKADVTVSIGCFSQAIALGVDGIVTTANTATLQGVIKEAWDNGIPTAAIHGSAVVGPDEKDNLLYNNVSSPIEIARAMADFVIADSKGKGRVIILYLDSHSIANAKGNAMKDRIEECPTMELLDFVTIGLNDLVTVAPTLMASWIAQYGVDFYVMSVSDSYYDPMIPALRNGGIDPKDVRLVGSDGENAAYERIRNGEYQIATVPEPSTMFGYMCVDELNRHFSGQPQYVWSPQLHIVTKENADTEGGKDSMWIPSNNFAKEYAKIWGIE